MVDLWLHNERRMVMCSSGIMRSRRGGKWTFCVSLLAFVLVVGCESVQNGGSQRLTARGGEGEYASSEAVQHPMLEGIPLPSGFTMIPEQSVGRSSGRFRVATVVFEGRGDAAAVNRFFKEYMPSAGFTLTNEQFVHGKWYMRYRSDVEECNIEIEPGRYRTVVLIDIGPVPRGSAEREVQPPVRTP